MLIRIIHWKPEEIIQQIQYLRNKGHRVEAELPAGQNFLKSLSQDMPDVFIIDLSRLPSQGRDLAIYLRKNKATRLVPQIFINGNEKIRQAIKSFLPDVFFSDWKKVEPALKAAVSARTDDVHVPQSVFEAYKNKDVTRKLAIKEKMHVDIINGPDNVPEILGPLPPGVTLGQQISSKSQLILWFVRTQSDLAGYIKKVTVDIGSRSIWIIWPKKAGRISSDLTQQEVRQSGLNSGLVDFKICSLDADWSGLLFRRRKAST